MIILSVVVVAILLLNSLLVFLFDSLNLRLDYIEGSKSLKQAVKGIGVNLLVIVTTLTAFIYILFRIDW